MYELTYGRARLGKFDSLEDAQNERDRYHSRDDVKPELLRIWTYEPIKPNNAEISMGLDGLTIEDINRALVDEGSQI
ncbi:hypothetical protein KU306_11990 [Haloferax larsenii]|uniref:Uncharacterized protein n=1 Tax=Haloferax larsenii TaxID=302484 RepID=A0ABY5RBU0_HALLR|nr:hypothetical protein [Haloferax larsenii]UVE49629.1 hypothetical protein KU306_11990 [Haloferax larsenii]